MRLTAVLTLKVNTSSFLRNGTMGLQMLISDTASATVAVTTSTSDPDSTAFGRGIELAGSQSSQLNFNIDTNPAIKGKGGVALAVVLANSATGNGFITNNSVVGSPGDSGSGILVRASNTAQMKVEISDNTVDKQGLDNGIAVDTVSSGGTSRIDAVMLRNAIPTDTNTSYGLNVTALASHTVCAYVANNTVNELATGGGFGQNGVFRGRASSAGATLLLKGFNTNVPTTWINNGNTPANAAREPKWQRNIRRAAGWRMRVSNSCHCCCRAESFRCTTCDRTDADHRAGTERALPQRLGPRRHDDNVISRRHAARKPAASRSRLAICHLAKR